MAGFNECVADIIKASGDILSKREAGELLRKFNDATKSLPPEERLGSLNAVLAEFQENMVRRNDAFNLHAKQVELLHEVSLGQAVSKAERIISSNPTSAIDKVTGYKHTVKNALETLFYGRPGERDGLVNHYEGVRTRFNVALAGPLQEKGLMGHWADKDTVHSAIDFVFNPGSTTISKEAQQIGAVLNDVYRLASSRLNKAGAYVLPTPNTLFNVKVADPAKIRNMGLDAFKDFVNGLNLDKRSWQGMDAVEIEKHVEKIYERLANGDQFRAPTGTFDGIGGLTKERYRNLASSNSLDYDLPFADAQSYRQFHEAFSDEPIQASISRRVEQIGRAVGLMEAFGPSPERFLDDLLAKLEPKMTADDKTFLLKQGSTPGPVSKLDFAKGIMQQPARFVQRLYLDAHPKDALAYMTGATSAPVDITGARLGAGLRSWASMASLGNGIFMQLTDMPLKVAQLIRYGKDPFQALTGPIEAFAQSFPNEERKAFYTRLGVSADIMMRNMAHNVSGGEINFSAKAMDTYFKLNGMSAMDRISKQHTADFLSSNLAWALNDPQGEEVKNLFRQYGFTEPEFEKMKGAIADMDGIEVVHPKNLEAIDDKLYEKYLGAMNDLLNTTTPTPGVREKAVSLKGTRPGTMGGELLRTGMMFKNYPAMLLTRVYPAIQYEHGVGGTMATMLGMMTMWYIGDSMKQLSQGKTPKDMSKPEVMVEAMTRSGLGGLYSDLIANDFSRQGMGVADVLGGPVAGHLTDLLGLGSAAVRGEATPKLAAQKLNRALPNIHFGKTLLEHSLIYGIMEMSDPGSVQASYDRLQQRTGQERLF